VPDASPPGPPPFTFAYVAWGIALLSMLGSLFFGEVMKLPPCTLCWYQRVCLFPLPVILAVGIALRDGRLVAYALPLAVVGAAFGVYHNLLYFGVIPEALSPCVEGISCKTRQIEWLGFITIPLMALASFVSIIACLLAHRSLQRRSQDEGQPRIPT
jgi:disulfide bond formation protein DsbB